MIEVCVLGSSSKGNCTYINFEGSKILIDAGLSAKIIDQRLSEIKTCLSEIKAIFITHEHADHINGLKGILKKHDIPIYCTRFTAQAIEETLKISPEFYLFSPSDPFSFDSFTIEAFSVFHDAQDPVGFCMEGTSGKLSLASDLGYVTSLVKQKVSGSNIMVIESNHDPRLLLSDMKRPWHVKQRIKGRQGHLSNENACKLVKDVACAKLQHIVLYHLSQDCNVPELALKKMSVVLREINQNHIQIHISHPNKISGMISYQPEPLHADFEAEIPMVL